ncbi:MAG: hypothetical protein HGA71_09800 [Azonexaceae bacterium]|nr:hypothetical protein [Azonexaceae bacterium]
MVTIQGMPSLKKTELSAEGKTKLKPALAAISIEQAPVTAKLAKWTQKTDKALHRKPDSSGFISSWKETFRVSVSEAQVSRAIVLLDKIEKALTEAGMAWEFDKKGQYVVGKMYGETLSFELKELYKRTEHIEKHPSSSWLDRKTYTYKFMGDLTLRIDGYYEGRKSWSDGKTQRIEEKLPEIIEGLLAAAESMRQRTIEREEQHKRWAEEARIRAEKERIAREEKAFFDATLKDAEDWAKSNKIREYAAHLRTLIAEHSIVLTEAGEEWLCRIEKAARQNDPALKHLSL